jgi:hypothetical protein
MDKINSILRFLAWKFNCAFNTLLLITLLEDVT